MAVSYTHLKAAAWLAANSISDEIRLFEGSLRHPPLPLALVGTTAGTGSEVTAVAVLTVDRDHRKRSVTHPNCYAKLVFADPRYTYTCLLYTSNPHKRSVHAGFSGGRKRTRTADLLRVKQAL